MEHINSCLFCGIGQDRIPSTKVFENDDVLAFLDLFPIRKGHVQIIPRQHFAFFDELPTNLLNEIVAVGQLIARAQKSLYKIKRAAFLFSGGDVAHVHAHVVPLHEKTDITSRQYIAEKSLTFGSPPQATTIELAAVAKEIRSALPQAR